MHIVSLVPAATEIVFALGLGDELVGRTGACDEPAEASEVAVVTSLVRPAQASGGRDAALSSLVRHAAHGGGPPARLDGPGFAALEPDLVLTQDSCDGCSPLASDLAAALRSMSADAQVVRLEPQTLEGVLNTISTIGAYAAAEDEAVGLLEILRERLGVIENRVLERRLMGLAPPRVVVLAWIDPPYVSGSWVPELVRRAGGWDVLGEAGAAPVETSWSRIRDVDPSHLILAPAGLDAARAAAAFSRARLPDWLADLRAVREGGLCIVDGSVLWRPGPRLIDGVGLLAELFDPEGHAGEGPTDAWIPLGVSGSRPDRGD
jgi:iron complex transport system substrate-binding protein